MTPSGDGARSGRPDRDEVSRALTALDAVRQRFGPFDERLVLLIEASMYRLAECFGGDEGETDGEENGPDSISSVGSRNTS